MLSLTEIIPLLILYVTIAGPLWFLETSMLWNLQHRLLKVLVWEIYCERNSPTIAPPSLQNHLIRSFLFDFSVIIKKIPYSKQRIGWRKLMLKQLGTPSVLYITLIICMTVENDEVMFIRNVSFICYTSMLAAWKNIPFQRKSVLMSCAKFNVAKLCCMKLI